MLRLLFRVCFVSVLVLTVASFTMKMLGYVRPAQPVMAGFDDACVDKPRPCWYGVTLGETTASAVQILFARFGDSFYDNIAKGQLEIFKTNQGGCFAQFVYGKGGSTIINEIILTNCARLRLGDLLAYYDEPKTLGASVSCDPTHPIIQHDNYIIQYPEDGIIASINRPVTLRPWLSLQGNIQRLYLLKPQQTDRRKTWAGLVSFERFVRLHREQVRNSTCGP